MKYTCLLILASLTVCNLPVSRGQGVPEDETGDRTTIDDIILQRAESLLLHSILKKIEDADASNEGYSSQPEWVTKRQHPGKRYNEDLERLQYAGRRDEDEDEDYTEVQKRQHPGKREDEMESFIDFQKRQHPGKRSMLEQISENPSLLSDLSKRQHPGRRYLIKYSKRQHPGKRNEEDGETEVFQDLEKRQHPGKRYLDNTITDLGANSPCDMLDPTSCSKANLLLELLDNVTKSRAEEKRQHPGKRLAPEEDLVVQE